MAVVMAVEDTGEDLVVAMQEDLVEVDFVAEVLEDVLPDFLVGAALVVAAYCLVYVAEA